MTTETVECVVVGAGVVGLAVAAELAERGSEVIVCEKETAAGRGITARNSGVVHAGIYYPADSLKAKLCVEGKSLLYEFCTNYGVAFRKCGKLVVATNKSELDILEDIRRRAQANHVTDLKLLSKEETSELEPTLSVEGALLSPSSGIVDPAELVTALMGKLEDQGGIVALGTEIARVEPSGDGLLLITQTGDRLLTKKLVLCCGLAAQTLVSSVTGYPVDKIPQLRMVRGNYFAMQGVSPFNRLIYPVPVKGGLGIHATLDITGQVRFGPDVEPTSSETYDVNATREEQFRCAIARYYPEIAARGLTPDYVGIRPQIGPLGEFRDFHIADETEHGIPGLLTLFGIESPGLTASLAIAGHVSSLL